MSISKPLIVIILLFGSIISLPSLGAWFHLYNGSLWYFYAQLFSLVLGFVFPSIMKNKLALVGPNLNKEKVLVTFCVVAFSFFLSSIILYFSPCKSFWLIWPTQSISFLFPLLMLLTVETAITIPKEEFKTWLFPARMEMPDIDKLDFTNSLVLTFHVQKKDNDRLPTVMKFKAPQTNINFGDLFYMYISEYNDANRESPIEYIDPTQNRYEWIFYIKPKYWWNQKKVIDPSLTVRENNMKENMVIVPYRV